MRNSCADMTVGQKLCDLGLDPDPFVSAQAAGNWWSFKVCGIDVYCYNFSWRRKALAFHDLHHVVTDYPCTMRGEMQVATWEYAAGSYSHFFAKLFCLPLVLIGTIFIPKKTFAAYRAGKESRSLYSLKLDSSVTILPVSDLKSMTKSQDAARSIFIDLVGFAGLNLASLTLYLLPLLAVAMSFRHLNS
jgi:hypothetical protein